MTRGLVMMCGVGLMSVGLVAMTGCQNSSSGGDPAAASASAAVSAAPPMDHPDHDRGAMMDRGDGGPGEHGDHPPPMMGDGGAPPDGMHHGGMPGREGHERH